MNCKTEITHHFEVLGLKALVLVFAPLRPFHNTNVTKVKCSNFLHIKVFYVWSPVFYTSKVLAMKSGFFCTSMFLFKSSHYSTQMILTIWFPHKFMISAQHWYTVQKEVHTERVLCRCQSWSRHQIMLNGSWLGS